MSQQKKNALLGNGWPQNIFKAVISTGSDPRTNTDDRPDLSSEGAPYTDKTVNVKQ
jgi:hypothetical protein